MKFTKHQEPSKEEKPVQLTDGNPKVITPEQVEPTEQVTQKQPTQDSSSVEELSIQQTEGNPKTEKLPKEDSPEQVTEYILIKKDPQDKE